MCTLYTKLEQKEERGFHENVLTSSQEVYNMTTIGCTFVFFPFFLFMVSSLIHEQIIHLKEILCKWSSLVCLLFIQLKKV